MKKQNKIILIIGIGIILIALLLVLNNPRFLTTVFTFQNSSGANINPPQTIEECHQIGGIVMPSQFDCGKYFVEFGNAGSEAICCVLDSCQGHWVRVFNPSLQAFEKICQ